MIPLTGVWDAKFSPDLNTLITGSDDGTVRVWIAARGFSVRRLMLHKEPILAVAISPTERLY